MLKNIQQFSLCGRHLPFLLKSFTDCFLSSSGAGVVCGTELALEYILPNATILSFCTEKLSATDCFCRLEKIRRNSSRNLICVTKRTSGCTFSDVLTQVKMEKKYSFAPGKKTFSCYRNLVLGTKKVYTLALHIC